jgi:hypothetical protein
MRGSNGGYIARQALCRRNDFECSPEHPLYWLCDEYAKTTFPIATAGWPSALSVPPGPGQRRVLVSAPASLKHQGPRPRGEAEQACAWWWLGWCDEDCLAARVQLTPTIYRRPLTLNRLQHTHLTQRQRRGVNSRRPRRHRPFSGHLGRKRGNGALVGKAADEAVENPVSADFAGGGKSPLRSDRCGVNLE